MPALLQIYDTFRVQPAPYAALEDGLGLVSVAAPGAVVRVEDVDYNRPPIVPGYLSNTFGLMADRQVPAKLVTCLRQNPAKRPVHLYLMPKASPLRYTFKVIGQPHNLVTHDGNVVLRDQLVVTSMQRFQSKYAPQLTPRLRMTPEEMAMHPEILFVTVASRGKSELDMLMARQAFVPVSQEGKVRTLTV